MCSLFPIRLIKVVRMHPSAVETLFLLPKFKTSLKIIYLFRDPLNIMNSRMNTPWYQFKKCINVENVCEDMETDMIGAYKLMHKYPGKVITH